jgi:hypothetical protein
LVSRFVELRSFAAPAPVPVDELVEWWAVDRGLE